MSKRYPHIADNGFPGINTRVYNQYDNTFDYETYADNKTVLKPCCVRWTNDSSDRVAWPDNDTRDSWFDALDSPVYTTGYISGLNYVGGSSVKLPIPYQALQRYNYLMVQVPATPVANNDGAVERLYYHIIDTHYSTASVTECTLELDAWTTYQHDVTIARIDLARGHYPMTLTDVQSYLSNPMTNNSGLLAAESDAPDISNIVSYNDYYSVGNDGLMVCFAMRAAMNDITAWRAADPAAAGMTPPVYSDAQTYYGAQYNVDGYRWATDGDYSNVNNPCTNTPPNNVRPTGFTVVCAPAMDALNPDDVSKNLLEYCKQYYPQFYSAVEAIFIVPKELITLGKTFKIGSFTLHVADNKNSVISNIKLTKNMFAYPKEYANITKLYTTPYSAIKVFDIITNNTVIFNVQDFSDNVTVSRRCNIMYPYINAQILISGIGSNQNINFKWKLLNNKDASNNIPSSGYNYIYNYDIPTFELMVDNTVLYYISNYNNAANIQRETALNTYHNSVRSGNTAAYNTTQMAGRNRANAVHNADTAKSNAILSADNQVSNTALSINNASYANGRRNALSTAVVDRQNDVADGNCVDTTNHMLYERIQIHDNMSLQTVVQNSSTRALTNNENQSSYLSAASGGVAAAAGIAVGAVVGAAGIAAAPVTGGASAAASVALAGSAVSQGVSTLNAMSNTLVGAAKNDEAAEIVCSTNSSLTAYTQTMNQNITQDAVDKNISIKNRTTSANTYINTQQVTINTEITNNNNNTSRSITANNSNLIKTTAANTHLNATNNARFMETTINENNTRTQETSIDIAKRDLELRQRVATWVRDDMSRSRTATIAQARGDALPDMYANNGVLVQVVTQPPEVVRRVADNFLRYGYAYGHTVEAPELLCNAHFSYWQGDALVVPDNAPLQAVNSIHDMFARGVTMWDNGNSIGGSIYDNEVR